MVYILYFLYSTVNIALTSHLNTYVSCHASILIHVILGKSDGFCIKCINQSKYEFSLQSILSGRSNSNNIQL